MSCPALRRSARNLASTALAVLLAGAALAQDQTWYEQSGSYIEPDDHWGTAVCLVADVNADGCDEMLVGAPDDTSFGSAYLISGKAPHLLLKQFHGAHADADFGRAVGYAGLVNADAVPDYMVASPREWVWQGFFPEKEVGVVNVYNGASGTVIHRIEGTDDYDHFGEALAGNADATGDGRPDILVGAPNWPSGSEIGYVELHDGATGALVKRQMGANANDRFGAAVAFVGDLTGDGRSEYAVGAPGANNLGLLDTGRLWVYDGATQALLYEREAGGDEHMGASVCGLGDTDGDGLREVLVGVPGDFGGEGSAWAFEGSAGTLKKKYLGAYVGTQDHFGSSVASIGDLDKDGRPDLAIGATLSDFGGGGMVRVFDGADGTILSDTYYAFGDGAGALGTLDGGRDVNGDGWPDLLVGLPGSDVNALNAGRTVCTGLLTYQEDLGHAGPHSAQLSVYGGKLASGSLADLALKFGPANGTGFLMLSVLAGNAPFKGGLLVPAANPSILLTFPIGTDGKLLLPGVPGGGGPLTLYAQFILSGYTSGTPIGLSNALKMQFLP